MAGRTVIGSERNSVESALRYWRTACALSAAHVFGISWPPPGRPQRSRIVGHWGANPGIAWVVGHLASNWEEPNPFLLTIGTGHATSFIVAHEAMRQGWSSDAISSAAGRYGQKGGDPSELIGWPPGIPFLSGELGPAVAISQGIAVTRDDLMVVCVVGDGECETAAAIAGFAHRSVLFGNRRVRWLPVVNANGATMGGPARYDSSKLSRIFHGFGYEVLLSNDDPRQASEVAREALAKSNAGLPVVWLSVTAKGWPAPDPFAGRPFRGAAAHKPPSGIDPMHEDVAPLLSAWLNDLTKGLLGEDGSATAEVQALARRVTVELPAKRIRPLSASPKPDAGPGFEWKPTVAGIDEVAANRSVSVFCPDEAGSNRLNRCLASGLVVEVLSEETCFAWAQGSVEAGRPALFATYEAFAPLVSTQIAQYAKLVHNRPQRNTPPLVVLLTSLGWANSPTHQNTDLVGTVIARPLRRLRLIYPVGATSAASRLESVFDQLRDGLAVISCSKQSLPDIPDPGGAVLEITLERNETPSATILAVGDVGVTEAIAAMSLAASFGMAIRTVAVVDLSALDDERGNSTGPLLGREPAVGVLSCAPRLLQGLLWEVCDRIFPIYGYREQYGATAWETLYKNQLDRYSLVAALLSSAGVSDQSAFRQLSLSREAATANESVPLFETPNLVVQILR